MDITRLKINNEFYPDEKSRQQKGWLREVYDFVDDFINNKSFILQKTSGSTGQPKEISLSKKAMTASAARTIKYLNLKKNDTALLCLPVQYVAGKMMIVRAMVGGMNLIPVEPRGTLSVPSHISIDFAAMLPMQVQNLLNNGYDFRNIKTLIIGGATINQKLEDEVQKLTTKVFLTFGMTETCSHIAMKRINGKEKQVAYHVLDGISIQKDESGCLVINAPELLDKPLITGDIVEIISKKEFNWKGRADNIINSGGIKISPEDLENRIGKIIRCECVIIPKKDKLLGQKIVLCLEKTDFPNKEEALNILKHNLHKYEVPKEILYFDSFPRNASMKIDRITLKDDALKRSE